MHLHEQRDLRSYSSLTLSNQSYWPRTPFIPPARGQWQERLAYLLFGLLALLLAIFATLAYRYLTPQERWLTLGHATEFPIAEPQPIAMHVTTGDTVHVWVVNTGEEFIVLDAMPDDMPRYRVAWEGASYPPHQWYTHPMRATRYTMLGLYTHSGTPPQRSLDRYPVRINAAGELTINPNQLVLGPTLEQLPQACTPYPGEDPDKPDLQRIQACDASWLATLRAEKLHAEER